jgi:hypothetical protein
VLKPKRAARIEQPDSTDLVFQGRALLNRGIAPEFA